MTLAKEHASQIEGSMRTIGAEELSYLRRASLRETDVQRRLREATVPLASSSMAAPPEVSQLLALLVRATGATRVVEVGVFTGLTTLAMALALPEGGGIIACDLPDAESALALARRHWREAGVEKRIDLRLGPARETLQKLIDSNNAGTIDLVFVDADKESYDAYYEQALVLLRQGGLMAFDNMLWYGAVADANDTSPSTKALRALSAKLHRDGRISLSLLPVGDGLALACKL